MTIIHDETTPVFNKNGSIFLGAQRELSNSKIAIVGVGYDGTTSYRPGARFGPAGIREASEGIETFCPQLNLDLSEMNFTDLGCLEIPFGAPEPVIKLVNKATKQISSLGMKPLILGGEHSISSGAVEAIVEEQSDLIMIQLDAHADLRKDWLGSKYNHACAMTRCLELLPSKKLFQVGIRSGTRDEFKELRAESRLIPHTHGKPANKLREALIPFLNKPIYLSIDLDWFDPSILPGTGTPEPGGYSWQDFACVLDVLKEHKIIAADIVELAPKLDPSGISNILAAKVTRSVLLLLSLSNSN